MGACLPCNTATADTQGPFANACISYEAAASVSAGRGRTTRGSDPRHLIFGGGGPGRHPPAGYVQSMKKLLEILVCFLHPVAVVLMWIDLVVDRPDLGTIGKLAWGIFGLIPLVPVLYVLTGGDLW